MSEPRNIIKALDALGILDLETLFKVWTIVTRDVSNIVIGYVINATMLCSDVSLIGTSTPMSPTLRINRATTKTVVEELPPRLLGKLNNSPKLNNLPTSSPHFPLYLIVYPILKCKFMMKHGYGLFFHRN